MSTNQFLPARHNADWELHLYAKVSDQLGAELWRNAKSFEERIGRPNRSFEERLSHEFNLSAMLGLQGLFERQFRLWLEQSAFDLKWSRKQVEKLRRASWTGADDSLENLLVELRAFGMDDVEQGSALRELCLVANAVKHGNGTSTARLYADFPALFRQVPWEPGQLPEMADEPEKLAVFLSVSSDDLLRYGRATAGFWETLSTRYNQQLEESRREANKT